ncbi:hypothetical protein E5Z46_18740 [Geobacillus kaustophilus NBRC 102445]|uniref:hypothetical protein n=1 Tax=Geobacillus kaustophilus TaxID=1462 RepID=UPI0010BE3DF9|nr:hypothetical protein [Geobacillus kaustophilus]QCK84056.1 hypothetical protein E5Z46_18740 [Geobacillus kaustophilus NBRC 102445]
MKTMTFSEFKKKVLSDKHTKEYKLCPWNTQEELMQRVLVESPKVDSLTIVTYKRKKVCLVIPSIDQLARYDQEVTGFLGVIPTYYTVREFDTNKYVATVRLD